MRLSIIVPVYNVEKYLERCVTSVFRQNLSEDDFEIVMVNDGSTDDSYHVAQELASRYHQIKLYSQENGGLSAARNTGLKHALGRYIQFLDSDDWLLDDSLRPILKIAEDKDLDICAFRMKVLDNQGRAVSHSYEQPFEFYKIYKGEIVVTHGLHFDSVCSNLYKRSFLNKESLIFAVGLTHEDVEFNSRVQVPKRSAIKE
jgi:glycosyltransferase involved in cell wall biosynthesis